MTKEKPLWERLYADPLLIDLARKIGYLGFCARELAEKCKHLAEGYGARRLSLALQEITTFEGNRVMLNQRSRKLCSQLLGPPPERRKAFYENTRERPADWDVEIEIPKGGPDPLMESLYKLTATDLEARLRQAKQDARRHPEEPSEVGAVESEMLRRGQEIPKEEPEKMEEPKKKRARKKAS